MDDKLSEKLCFEVDPITGTKVVKTLDGGDAEIVQDDYSTYPGRDPRLAPRPQRQKVLSWQSRPNRLRPMFPAMRPPFPPPRPPAPPMPNPAVRLSREIYQKFDTLLQAYRDLQKIQSSQQVANLESQTLIMRSTAAGIYRTLSGEGRTPSPGLKLTLSENYCEALGQTQQLVNELSGDILRLMRLVSIPSIDRQLLILNATLLSQAQTLERLRSECEKGEIKWQKHLNF